MIWVGKKTEPQHCVKCGSWEIQEHHRFVLRAVHGSHADLRLVERRERSDHPELGSSAQTPNTRAMTPADAKGTRDPQSGRRDQRAFSAGMLSVALCAFAPRARAISCQSARNVSARPGSRFLVQSPTFAVCSSAAAAAAVAAPAASSASCVRITIIMISSSETTSARLGVGIFSWKDSAYSGAVFL